MRIAFNTLNESARELTGMIDFYRHMVRWLPRLGPQHEFLFLTSRTIAPLLGEMAPNARTVLAGLSNECRPGRLLSEQLLIPLILKFQHADVFFSTSFVSRLVPRNIGVVYALYATQHLKSGLIGRQKQLYRTLMTGPSLRRADRILLNSDFCRTEAQSIEALPPEKIAVVHHGLDMRLFNTAPLTDADYAYLSREGLEQPYFLFVSHMYSYKNVPTLIDGFAKAVHKGGLPHLLVLAGGFPARQDIADQTRNELMDQARERGVADRIRFQVRISTANLRALYARATAYVQPSLYETFGKTTVEAMACGCPLIWADVSATPEIAGDAGLKFAPMDSDALGGLLLRVATEPELAAALRRKGLERAGAFEIEDEARKILQIMEAAARR